MSNNITRTLTIPSDSDGFVTFQCPYCKDRFKLTVSFIEQEETIELFCPYCGLQHEVSYFLRDEVIEQAQIIAKNLAIDVINEVFRDWEQKSKSSDIVTFKVNQTLKKEEEKLLFERDQLEQFHLSCCDLDLKVNSLSRQIGVYCPYCGIK